MLNLCSLVQLDSFIHNDMTQNSGLFVYQIILVSKDQFIVKSIQ